MGDLNWFLGHGLKAGRNGNFPELETCRPVKLYHAVSSPEGVFHTSSLQLMTTWAKQEGRGERKRWSAHVRKAGTLSRRRRVLGSLCKAAYSCFLEEYHIYITKANTKLTDIILQLSSQWLAGKAAHRWFAGGCCLAVKSHPQSHVLELLVKHQWALRPCVISWGGLLTVWATWQRHTAPQWSSKNNKCARPALPRWIRI